MRMLLDSKYVVNDLLPQLMQAETKDLSRRN